MKIVLLGASGQLGREWRRKLDHHPEVTLLPYNSSQLDITHYQRVSKELQEQKPDVVVNCAAYTDVDGAEENRKLAQKVNVEAVLYLAELSRKLDFKLVHFSTDYVFAGKAEDREKLPNGYPEDHLADPLNWYGKTKWEGEQAIRHTTGNYLILRVSWLCGRFGSNFIKTMLQLGRERDELQVVDDQWGSPTFTENVAENTLRLIRDDKKGTFHITTKGLISWYELARAIFKYTGTEVNLQAVSSDVFPAKAKRPAFSKLCTEKIEAVEGSRIVGWEEGLKELLAQI